MKGFAVLTAPAPSGWIDVTANTPNMEGPLFVASDSTGAKLFIGGNNGGVGAPALSLNEGSTFTGTDPAYMGAGPGLGGSSSNGQVLAYIGGNSGGTVYDFIRLSTDGGSSWSTTSIVGTTGGLYPFGMAGSGTKMVAADVGGGIYISTDTGSSFAIKAPFGIANWLDVKYSRDGSTIYAAATDVSTIGSLMKSTDDGTSAADVNPEAGNNVTAVCCSADGSYVVCALASTNVYTSSNGGSNWTMHTNGPDGKICSALACSDDGQTVLFSSIPGSTLWLSTDGGANWTAQSPMIFDATSMSMSADGTKRAVTVPGDVLWVFA